VILFILFYDIYAFHMTYLCHVLMRFTRHLYVLFFLEIFFFHFTPDFSANFFMIRVAPLMIHAVNDTDHHYIGSVNHINVEIMGHTTPITHLTRHN